MILKWHDIKHSAYIIPVGGSMCQELLCGTTFPPSFPVSLSDCCLGQSAKCTGAMSIYMNGVKSKDIARERGGKAQVGLETEGKRTSTREGSLLADSVYPP